MEEERNQQGNPEEMNHEEANNEEVKEESLRRGAEPGGESLVYPGKGQGQEKEEHPEGDSGLGAFPGGGAAGGVPGSVVCVHGDPGGRLLPCTPPWKTGERLFVTVLDMKLNGAERGDIVICNYPGRYDTVLGIRKKQYFVKRVVAVGGDTVWRKNNATYVTYGDTGETVALDEEYASRYPGYDYEYQLQEDEYFVVGDNRGNSHDSRDWQDATPDRDVGPISKDMLVGHVRFVFWPLDEIGGVK